MEATKTFESPAETKLHFLDYWRIIRVRKTVILAVFLLVAITTTVVTFVLPPTYASTARIIVQKDGTDIQSMSGAPVAQGFDPFWIQTEFEKIQSKIILYTVITNLDLNRKWGEKYKEGYLPTEVAFNILKSRLDVNQARSTSVIEIKVESDDKEEASLIANKIADVYRQSRLNRWQEMTGKGLKTLEEEMQNHLADISRLQGEIDELKQKFKISDVEGQMGLSAGTLEPTTLRRTEDKRIDAQSELTQKEGLLGALTNYSPAELRRSIQTASPDNLLLQLSGEMAAEEQRLAILTNSLGFEHPEVKGTREKIEVVNLQVAQRVSGIVDGLKASIEGKKAEVRMLSLEVDRALSNDIAQAVQQAPYREKKRAMENLRWIRERLVARIWQEKVDYVMPKSGIVEIIETAEPGIRPVKPRKLLAIGLGVVAGLIMGVGLAFFIEYLDTSVKTIDDVERALQTPVLGVIPQNVGHLLFEGPDSPHAEAYRVLRTNILFSLKDPKLNTITIVSAGAGEGKSTTIFNLATIFAQNGSRVLVVDSDLRRPSLHKVLKVSNSIGLTNVLMKQNTLEEVIQTSSLPSLDFMPSGKLPSSSMGVLSSAQMKELIRDLKRRYDYVFFDSPPIMGVSDASILASEVDSVLQVIQYRRYPQPMTIRAKQMIEKVGGNLLGIVLNNINMASDENYYYYSGYYYDYYSKSDDSEPEKPAAGSKSSGKTEQIEIKPKY